MGSSSFSFALPSHSVISYLFNMSKHKSNTSLGFMRIGGLVTAQHGIVFNQVDFQLRLTSVPVKFHNSLAKLHRELQS